MRQGRGESIGEKLGRLAKTAYECGLVGQTLSGQRIEGLKVALRHGLDVRSIHRFYRAVYPERPALVDGQRQLTYREADDEIERLVRALEQRYGVGDGTPVALMMENRVEYVAAWFALFRLGASGVHVSYRASADELAYQLEHSGARLLICSACSRDVAEQVQDRMSDRELGVIDVPMRTARGSRRTVASSRPGPGCGGI
ncbi:MAG: AMP-binding protein [Bradymonadaceae bacterium]